MLIWIFFVGDLLSIIAMLGMHYDFIPGWRFPFTLIMYLLIKGVVFFGDFLSIMDMVVALYMMIMLFFNVSWFLTWFAVAYLLYKLMFTVVK
jgi:hypothetical protein